MVACCCWRAKHTKNQQLHSGRLHRSRSLDREPAGEYKDLVLEERSQQESPDSLLSMGNTQGSEAKEGLLKSGSSSSLKSSNSLKSSSSRRSKVTFTELHPEIYMIPPKSPPKPKRTRGTTRVPVTAEEEMDLILAMQEDQLDSQAAFQFDLSKQAELVSLEDVGKTSQRQEEKIYDLVAHEDTPEDVHQVAVEADSLPCVSLCDKPHRSYLIARLTANSTHPSRTLPQRRPSFVLSKHSFGNFMKSCCLKAMNSCGAK